MKAKSKHNNKKKSEKENKINRKKSLYFKCQKLEKTVHNCEGDGLK